jgi:hypothetical protein
MDQELKTILVELLASEAATDCSEDLTLAQHTAGLVASALEIVHPDQNRELRNARALALALQNLCTDG